MSKKTKKAAKERVKLILRILKTGKIKTNGHKYDIDKYTRNSISMSSTGRVVDNSDDEGDTVKSTYIPFIVNEESVAKYRYREASKCDQEFVQEIIVPVTRKNVEAIDLTSDSTLGRLAVTSNFISVYKIFKKSWMMAIEEYFDRNRTPVYCHMKKILVFLDYKTGKPLKHPYVTDVVLVITKTADEYRSDWNTDDTDSNISKYIGETIIADIIKAIHTAKCNNPIISMGCKPLNKFVVKDVCDAWVYALHKVHNINNIALCMSESWLHIFDNAMLAFDDETDKSITKYHDKYTDIHSEKVDSSEKVNNKFINNKEIDKLMALPEVDKKELEKTFGKPVHVKDLLNDNPVTTMTNVTAGKDQMNQIKPPVKKPANTPKSANQSDK